VLHPAVRDGGISRVRICRAADAFPHRAASDKGLKPHETGSGARTLGDDPNSLAPFGMTAPLALLSRSRPPARQTFLPFRPRQHAVSKTHRTRNASTSYGAPANSHRHWGDHDRSVPCERKSGRRGVRQGTRAHCPALPRRVGRSRRAPGARGLATRVGASMMGVYVCSSTKPYSPRSSPAARAAAGARRRDRRVEKGRFADDSPDTRCSVVAALRAHHRRRRTSS
jgi:hypothetical protein